MTLGLQTHTQKDTHIPPAPLHTHTHAGPTSTVHSYPSTAFVLGCRKEELEEKRMLFILRLYLRCLHHWAQRTYLQTSYGKWLWAEPLSHQPRLMPVRRLSENGCRLYVWHSRWNCFSLCLSLLGVNFQQSSLFLGGEHFCGSGYVCILLSLWKFSL